MPAAPSKTKGNNQITEKVNLLLSDKHLHQGYFPQHPIHQNFPLSAREIFTSVINGEKTSLEKLYSC